jgi:hypothetical protein
VPDVAPPVPVHRDRYVRAALWLWAVLILCFIAILAFVIHLLREPNRQAREMRVNDDEVSTAKLHRAVMEFTAAYGRLPFPPDAPERTDRFLSVQESMQVMRALRGGESLVNPRAQPFLESPLVEPDGRMVDLYNRQYMFLFDFDGDGRIEFGSHSVPSRALVFSFGANGQPDRVDPGDDILNGGW